MEYIYIFGSIGVGEQIYLEGISLDFWLRFWQTRFCISWVVNRSLTFTKSRYWCFLMPHHLLRLALNSKIFLNSGLFHETLWVSLKSSWNASWVQRIYYPLIFPCYLRLVFSTAKLSRFDILHHTWANATWMLPCSPPQNRPPKHLEPTMNRLGFIVADDISKS